MGARTVNRIIIIIALIRGAIITIIILETVLTPISSNNKYLQPHARFSMSNGAINEPKKESVEHMFKRYMQKNEGEKKIADNRVNVMEGTMAKMSENLSGLTTHIAMMDTQMFQMHKIILDIDKRNKKEDAKAVARLEKINKEWAKKYRRSAETLVSEPLTGAGASGLNTGQNPEKKGELSGPPKPLQRSAEYYGRPEQIVRHNGIPLPFQSKKKTKLDEHFKRFLDVFCKYHINIPLVEALQEIPRYARLLREAVTSKRKLRPEDLKLPLHCSEIIQKQRAVKQSDPGQFIIRCSRGYNQVDKALYDLGASMMPLE